MTRREVNLAATELRDAVAILVVGKTVKVLGDDGVTQKGRLPSLWRQAIDALVDSREGTTRGTPGSRPPYDVGLADYLADVAASIQGEVRDFKLKVRDDTSADLRQVAEQVIAGGELNTIRLWTFKVNDWARGLRWRLGQSDARPALSIRDRCCPNCGQTHVLRVDPDAPADELPTVDPALIMPDPTQLEVLCMACGQQWKSRDRLFDLGHDVQQIADHEPPIACRLTTAVDAVGDLVILGCSCVGHDTLTAHA